MSKFSRGDIVDVPWPLEGTTRGVVHVSWGLNISGYSGLPMVEIFLLDKGFIGQFDEDDVELALDEYEFLAVEVDQEDFEQTSLGSGYEWGTLEEAERLIQRAKDEEDSPAWKESKQLQINRRRKAGHTVGFQAFRW